MACKGWQFEDRNKAREAARARWGRREDAGARMDADAAVGDTTAFMTDGRAATRQRLLAELESAVELRNCRTQTMPWASA